jgi:hypothetical protein
MLKQTTTELARHPGEATAQIFSGTSKTGVKEAQAVIARRLKQ